MEFDLFVLEDRVVNVSIWIGSIYIGGSYSSITQSYFEDISSDVLFSFFLTLIKPLHSNEEFKSTQQIMSCL